MAEVFGVVVSALTVAEMAGKLGGGIIKLKKLWDEVQDVPNEISQLVQQLEILTSLLAAMESEFTQQTEKVYRNSLNYCQQVVADLDALVEDLQSRIDAAKKSRRNITKLKVTFKKEQIRGYQEKIQFALQLLSLSQQTYTISVVKYRFLTFPDPAAQADSTQTTTPQPSAQPKCASDNRLTKRNVSSRTCHELATPAMPLWKASFFGGFVYRTVSDPDHPDIEVHQARVQLPRWISETFWDFQAYRARTGWKASLKPWTMRPWDDLIFDLCKTGSLDEVLQALQSNEASIQDIQPNGWTLLHVAMSWGQFDISKALIKMGLSLDVVDNSGFDSYYRLPIDSRFIRLDWGYVNPEVLLDEIHKSGNLEPADFRPVFDIYTESSLCSFTSRYFGELAWGGIQYYYPKGMSRREYNTFYHWRNLARWVFGGLSVKDLSQMEKRQSWMSLDFQVFGGLVEWQYCLLWASGRPEFGKLRAVQKAFLIWLEDVQAAGIDLAEYGRQELEIYLAHDSLQSRRWFHEYSSDPGLITSGWKLVGFTYGPEPRDWKFTWDLDAWEYSGDFWELVENPPLHIPGGWVDDESW
ncbi:hypothetical protein LZ32DRAFT_80181 [Colletotrichum eremochloae]|nr:hypothetical protein LZ32DRAFT_80181 [Colletotrichum eremochloae]